MAPQDRTPLLSQASGGRAARDEERAQLGSGAGRAGSRSPSRSSGRGAAGGRERSESPTARAPHSASSRGSSSRLAPKDVKLGFWLSLFTSLNYNLGLALLSFPYQVRLLGWTAFISLAVVCVICWITARQLGMIMRAHSDVHSYADIAGRCVSIAQGGSGGAGGRAAMAAAAALRTFQVVELWFYCVYNIVVVHEALQTLGSDSVLPGSATWLAIIAVMLPICLISSPLVLGKVSVVGIAAFFAVALIMLGTSAAELLSRGAGGASSAAAAATASSSATRAWHGQLPSEWELWPGDVMTWARSYGSILLLFAGHAVYPSLFENLAEPHRDYDAVVDYTFAIIAAFLLLLGAVENSAFHDLIVELPTGFLDTSTPLGAVTQVIIIVKCLAAYPVMASPIVTETASRFAENKARQLLRASSSMAIPVVDSASSPPPPLEVLPEQAVALPVQGEQYVHLLDADSPVYGPVRLDSFNDVYQLDLDSEEAMLPASAAFECRARMSERLSPAAPNDQQPPSSPPFPTEQKPGRLQPGARNSSHSLPVGYGTLEASALDMSTRRRRRTVPLAYSPFHPSRLHQVQRREGNDWFRLSVRRVQVATEVLTLLASVAMAAVVPGLAFVMCLVGSVFAVSLAVTLPGLFYAMVLRERGEPVTFALAVSAFGLLSMVISFAALFYEDKAPIR
jgi:amino acid permease